MTITSSTCGVWTLDDAYKKISAGRWATIGQLEAFTNGSIYTWGCNFCGALGDNTTINRSSPVQIPGNNWIGFAGGPGNTSVGLKNDGTLWSWGYGGQGSLGQNNTIPRSSPTQIPGTNWLCAQAYAALKSDGSLWTWGAANQLGLGTFIFAVSSPVNAGGNWCAISRGQGHTLLICATNNSGHGVGSNNYGQFGNGNTTNFCRISEFGSDWCYVDAGYSNSFIIKTNGVLCAAGRNLCGTLGINTSGACCFWTQIPGTTWSNVKGSRKHTLATKTDGTLWAWGDDAYGQLGRNVAFSSTSSPVQVPGTSWVAAQPVHMGNLSASFALKTDGTLWAWGSTGNGRLGLNTAGNVSSPTQIPGTNFTQLCGRTYHTGVIRP